MPLEIPQLPIVSHTAALASEMNARLAAISAWANGNITQDDIAELTILGENLAPGSVAESKITDLAVSERKLADGAVTSRKWKPNIGIARASSPTSLIFPGQSTAIPGIQPVLNAPVASVAVVFGRFSIQWDPLAPGGAGLSAQALTHLFVNDADQGFPGGGKKQFTGDVAGYEANFNQGDVAIWPVFMAPDTNYKLGLQLQNLAGGSTPIRCWGETYLMWMVMVQGGTVGFS